MHILHVETETQVEWARTLFLEYAESLDFSICFQNFDHEVKNLPRLYSAPEGRLLLAMEGPVLVGCVAMRSLSAGTCEMKRLYVRPSSRTRGIGRRLALAIIEEAKKVGYTRMRLDTMPSMKDAMNLYRSLGFYAIDPYYENPFEGALYMEKVLEEGV